MFESMGRPYSIFTSDFLDNFELASRMLKQIDTLISIGFPFPFPLTFSINHSLLDFFSMTYYNDIILNRANSNYNIQLLNNVAF